MNRKELYETAYQLVNLREQRAYAELEKRRREIHRVIPQIDRLEREMNLVAIRLGKEMLAHRADSSEQIAQIIANGEAMEHEMTALLAAHGYPKNYLDPPYTCKKCRDTGYDHGEICSCIQELVRQINTEEFNRSTTMQLCSFQDFDLQYYRQPGQPEIYERMADNLHFCKEYAKSFTKTSQSILMIGKTGLGKTHLSLAIAQEVINAGFQVVYGSAGDFFRAVQQEQFDLRHDPVTMPALLDADLLILDDLGAEMEHSAFPSILYSIINGRMNLQKPTIVNTNLDLTELERRYTNRIISRLITMFTTLRFLGTDVRQQKVSR